MKQQQQIKEWLSKYKALILKNIETELYRNDRYDTPFCLALFYAQDSGCLREIGENVRITDTYFMLDKEMACVVFAHSDMNDAYKACQNIINDYGYHNPDQRLYAGVSSVERFGSDQELIVRALHALSYAQKFPESTVENDNTLFYKF